MCIHYSINVSAFNSTSTLIIRRYLLLQFLSEKAKFDEVVQQDGVQVFIDRKAQLTLLGTEMDFVESKLSAEFVFNNPNIKGTCGCGESFNI